MAGRIRELMNKYGRVGLVVHFSVSFASFSSCYVAIKNNVDVNDLLKRVGLLPSPNQPPAAELPDGTVLEKMEKATQQVLEEDHAAVKVLNEGGAVALAFVCNKALLPVRIPLTVLLTPPVARLWVRTRAFRRG